MSGDANPLTRGDEERWPDGGPAEKQRLRVAYDRVAGRLARSHPRSTLVLLDAVGRIANRLGLHGPSPREVAALYDWLPMRRVRDVGRQMTALHLKNRAAIALVNSNGEHQLPGLVEYTEDSTWADIFTAKRPRILAASHIGAFFGIRAALARLDQPALMLRDLPLADQMSRARALKQAIDHLRAGGLVVATLDGPLGTSTSEVACLGRRIVLRRGPFMLARVTGAPLIPVACAWTSRGAIAMRVGTPIERSAIEDLPALEIEDAMAAQAARWIDRYLRAEPQEMWVSTLRHYLAAPLAYAQASSSTAEHRARASGGDQVA